MDSTSIIPPKKRVGYSEAENRFKNWIAVTYPKLKITRGLPDFMIVKDGEVVGFVEVKRDDFNDGLRKDQTLFMEFCKKHKITYQVWSPIMSGKRWPEMNDHLKTAFTYGGEIWEKIK